MKKYMSLVSLCYLTLPFLIFSLTFLRLYIGIPISFLIVYCLNYCGLKKQWAIFTIGKKQSLIIAALALFLCWISGIGGFYSQTGDYLVKNALLSDLCNHSWPIYIELSEESLEVQKIVGSDNVAFVYYLFFYLPAALVGKVFGLLVAKVAFLLWSSFGLFLVLCHVVNYVSERKPTCRVQFLLILLLFLSFGGLDILGELRNVTFHTLKDIFIQYPLFSFCETWCMPFFRLWGGNVHDLAFVFNQCIPAWLITMLILDRKDNCTMFFVYSMSLLYTPWAAIGLFPIVVYLWFVDRKGEKLLSASYFKQTLNVSNIVFPLVLLFIVGSYYTSNEQSVGTKGWFFDFMSIGDFCIYYPLFLLVEIGVYVALLRKQIFRIPILKISFMVLLALPFYHITPGNDLLMRASIPALFIFFVYWTKFAIENFSEKKILICAIMVITSFSAIQQTLVPIWNLTKEHKIHIVDPIGSFYYIETPSEAYMCDFQFFAHQYEGKFFFKYLARK